MADPADSPCAPLVACENLEGAVLVRRTVYGPSLIDDPRPLSFGEFALTGGAIRPFIDLMYETRWIPKGLCRGPVSSVMSLAPTESITAGVRTAHRDSFTQTMTDAAESSSVYTHTRHQLSESTNQSQGGGGGIGGIIGGVAGAVGQVAGGVAGAVGDVVGGVAGAAGQAFGVAKDVSGAVMDVAPIFVGLLGSIFEDIGSVAGDVVGAVVGAPVAIAGAAANAVGGLIDGAVGGVAGIAQGPALVDTTHRLNEITESMEHRESQSHVRQVVTSSSNESEEFVTRTFSNPYRDRSLQLRFLPIYKHYEVVTRIRFGIPGLAMIAGKIDNNVQRPPQASIVSKLSLISRLNLASDASSSAPAAGTPIASRLVSAASVTKVALASAQVNHDDSDVRHPMVELMSRNSSSAEREKGAHVEQGLRWSGAQVRDNALHVPLAEPEILTKAWKLDERVAGRLKDSLSRLSADRIVALSPKIETRQIHLFAGTHVEAVPGDCTLPDIVTDALSAKPNA